ncbi:unnamed protein product [Urochloa decumbens]|uniref:Uncharacterized protein n=1 Tax=Urochloa decumbens TaxID=240449 RepID=A0ABC8ZYJ8_9POAL
MARLTARLVWVAVLAVLSAGAVTLGNGELLDDFPYDLPQMRIISKQNPNLSLTARDETVVLAKTDFNDTSQVWFQDDRSIGTLGTDDGCRKPFALVNINIITSTAQAIVPPDDGSLPVKLGPYSPFHCVQLSTLWTKSRPVSGFSTIRMFSDDSRAFNGLEGTGKEGTVIGILPTDGVNPNVQWKIVDFSHA